MAERDRASGNSNHVTQSERVVVLGVIFKHTQPCEVGQAAAGGEEACKQSKPSARV